MKTVLIYASCLFGFMGFAQSATEATCSSLWPIAKTLSPLSWKAKKPLYSACSATAAFLIYKLCAYMASMRSEYISACATLSEGGYIVTVKHGFGSDRFDPSKRVLTIWTMDGHGNSCRLTVDAPSDQVVMTSEIKASLEIISKNWSRDIEGPFYHIYLSGFSLLGVTLACGAVTNFYEFLFWKNI